MKASAQSQPENKQSPKVAKGQHHLKFLASHCDLRYWSARLTAQGSLSEFWSILSPGPAGRTFVLPMLTQSTVPSLLTSRESIPLAVPTTFQIRWTRSNSYFYLGHPVRNSWDGAFSTVMNRSVGVRGWGLRQEPWWNPTFTLKSSLSLRLTCTLLLACSYMLCMRRTSHSSTTSLQKAHPITLSNAFPDQKAHVECTADGL